MTHTSTEQERPEELARKFHETYERLAPNFGYETRQDTRAFDLESANGKLMIAVCAELLAARRAPVVPPEAVHAIHWKDIEYTDQDCREAKMVVIERDSSGKPTVWCDPEIADLVRALNVGGVPTDASCSGHGNLPGSIMLRDGRCVIICEDLEQMRNMFSTCCDVDVNGQKREAAPVQLPEYGIDTANHAGIRVRGYTEQQVRQLLADQGVRHGQ